MPQYLVTKLDPKVRHLRRSCPAIQRALEEEKIAKEDVVTLDEDALTTHRDKHGDGMEPRFSGRCREEGDWTTYEDNETLVLERKAKREADAAKRKDELESKRAQKEKEKAEKAAAKAKEQQAKDKAKPSPGGAATAPKAITQKSGKAA